MTADLTTEEDVDWLEHNREEEDEMDEDEIVEMLQIAEESVGKLDPADIETIVETSKERIYVDDPSNVPQGAQMQEGERGGLYYDSDDVRAFEQAMLTAQAGVMEQYNFTPEQVDEAIAEVERYDANAEQDFQRLADAADEHIEGGQYRVKSVASALEKVHARDDASADSLDELGDVFGAMMFADSHETVEDTADAIKAELGEENIVEEENLLDNDGYYRAYHLDVDLGDGRQGEIQIKSQDMAELIEVGHKTVYKDETDIDLTDDDIAEISDCLQAQMDLLMDQDPDTECTPDAEAVIQEVQS